MRLVHTAALVVIDVQRAIDHASWGERNNPRAEANIAALVAGSLPVLPVIQIGGISASVQFAGLVSPGLFQFNVVVPATATDGDNMLTAQYNGLKTPTGVLLTVKSNNPPN